MIKLFKQMRRKEALMALLCAVLVVGQVYFDLRLPDYMTELTKLIKTPGSNTGDILSVGGEMLLCTLCSAVLAVGCGYLSARTAAGFSFSVRRDLFHHVMDAGSEEMQTVSVPSLITRTTNDITQIQNFLSMGLRMMCFAPIMGLGGLIMGLSKCVSLAWVLALALMALNVLTSESVNGARNWLEVAGYSLQPSELVKVAYIYVGASTLDRLYRRRNLYSYIAFSAACVIALALIGDFGTALIFFATFLVISFMRSGSIATVILAVTGAGLAGFLAVSVKPYIAQRFANWGHVWEDIYNTGFQQTRAMSAAASGALSGKGAGSGWLHNVFAANTDMVFAMICEELGLIIALCSIAAILVLAFFAVRSANRSRSAFYAIAACATVSMLLVQLSLNVFGSLDILPFTGVTFPFVSRGGTSLLSCWMLMAFIKGSDTRREGSFAVKPVTAESRVEEDEDEYEYEEDDYDGEDAE